MKIKSSSGYCELISIRGTLLINGHKLSEINTNDDFKKLCQMISHLTDKQICFYKKIRRFCVFLEKYWEVCISRRNDMVGTEDKMVILVFLK